MLPKIDNFVEAQNHLDQVGTDSAWGVIESVLESILLRDQSKIVELLVKTGFSGPTSDVFSPVEQKSLLLQRVQNDPLRGTGQIRLAASDAARYTDQVQRWLPEHPFLKDGVSFTNDVIASYVLAKAIILGWALKDVELARKLARQPFLWRSIRSSIDGQTIIEGELLGYVLSSFWSDPLTKDETVVIRDLEEEGGSFVEILFRGEAVSFTATTPLHFYGQMRNVTIATGEVLSLVGLGDGTVRSFIMEGRNSVTGSVIDLRATELRIREGSTWLDAEVVPFMGQLTLIIADGVDYGWSERLSTIYPFNAFASTILPQDAPVDDVLVGLLADCAARSPTPSVTLFADYTVAENDYLRSIYNRYGSSFCDMITVLVNEGYAHPTPIPAAGGAPKVRIRLKVSFSELRDAARLGTADADLAACVVALRDRIH